MYALNPISMVFVCLVVALFCVAIEVQGDNRLIQQRSFLSSLEENAPAPENDEEVSMFEDDADEGTTLLESESEIKEDNTKRTIGEHHPGSSMLESKERLLPELLGAVTQGLSPQVGGMKQV